VAKGGKSAHVRFFSFALSAFTFLVVVFSLCFRAFLASRLRAREK
jgi:cbb3-type cytochrome oxidase subunit 3